MVAKSLDQRLNREQLEEATTAVRSVARADAFGLLNNWFGIIVAGLPFDEANAFKASLHNYGCETTVVADADIPALHEDFRCQRLDLDGGHIRLTDAMGRIHQREKDNLVFAAAGFLNHTRIATVAQTDWRYSGRGTRQTMPAPVTVRTEKTEISNFFRIDLFFTTSPHRYSIVLGPNNSIFYGGRPIRLRNTTEQMVLKVDLASILPPERLNSSLQKPERDRQFPTLRAYEEEIRWAFYWLGVNS